MPEFTLITAKGKVRWSLALARGKDPEKCQAKFCRGKVRPEHKKGTTFCPVCCERILRKNNPVWRIWVDLKRHARLRKKPFTLTYAEFREFYAKKPRTSNVWTVDRIDPLRGYAADNIQWLSLSDNSRKGATFDKDAYAAAKRREPQAQPKHQPSDDLDDLEPF